MSDFDEGDAAQESRLFEGTPYRFIERLGSGAMGEVLLVEHRALGRVFAAKLLHPELASHPQVIERARLEAQSLGRLDHPHIVVIAGYGTTSDGRLFIVMEYLKGRSLAGELALRHRLPPGEALTLACQLLSALAAVHELGLVHRDVKPENLLLCERDDGLPFLKLLDFGIVRVMPESQQAPPPLSVPTNTGAIIGTPRFMSPEGAIGRRVDQRADLYGAALVLYTMLVGRGPFDHVRGDSNVLSAHAFDDPEPPSRYAASPVPPELDEIVKKALKKNPEERFQTAAEFKAELQRMAALMMRPSGWLRTTAFDAPAQGTAQPAVQSISAHSGPTLTAVPSSSSLLPEGDAPIAAPPLPLSTRSEPRRPSDAPARLSGFTLLGLFLLALGITALVIAVAVFLFQQCAAERVASAHFR